LKRERIVAFFARWKQKRELKRIERQVEREPSPVSACALIEKYIGLGQLENAEKVARQTVEFYPFSNTVQRAYRYLKKVKYYDELRRLTNLIEEKPTPTLYAMLAELYNELDETDRTLDVCRDGIKQFPTYEGMYLIMGKIRYNRYLEEGLPRDGLLAVEFFEKALELNTRDYKTLIRLSEIYLELGMRTKAVEKLKSVLYFAPEDERANELLKYAQTLPPEKSLDIEELFKELRQRRESEESEGRSSRFSLQDIEGRLWNFAELSGLSAIVCVKESGRKLASRILKEGANEDALCVGLTEIYSAAQDSSLRMDIGRFQQGIVFGSKIQVHMFRFENLVFAVVASAEVKAEAIQTAIDEFIDNQLYI
jgi:tetratricopeptide (TPR) repeat protein